VPLQIKRDKNGVPLAIQFQDIQHINIRGLSVGIISIQPATLQHLPFLMSLKDDDPDWLSSL
jgi:hypothetical protein